MNGRITPSVLSKCHLLASLSQGKATTRARFWRTFVVDATALALTLSKAASRWMAARVE